MERFGGKEELISKFQDAKNWENVGWRCPSNIALIKYWGKQNGQIPINPSLSFSLTNSFTETRIFYQKKKHASESISFRYLFEGEENQAFSLRIEKCLDHLKIDFPFLSHYDFFIESRNSFPHSAGIASSASAFGALALCICNIADKIAGNSSNENFFRNASTTARLGSGSAARSVFGGFTTWGKTSQLTGSSDNFAMSLNFQVNDIFKNLQDSVLIIDKNKKQVSSSQGHRLMDSHPQKQQRIKQANDNFDKMPEILKTGDFVRFTEVCRR